MKTGKLLRRAAFFRILGLLAFLGLGIAILGIPSLASRPMSEFKPEPSFYDGLERGQLQGYQDITALALLFYGGLLSYCLFRFLKEPRAAKSRWVDGVCLGVLLYFTIYIFLVHREWKFARALPRNLQAAFTQGMMPADRLGWFLICPADAFDSLVLEPRRFRPPKDEDL